MQARFLIIGLLIVLLGGVGFLLTNTLWSVYIAGVAIIAAASRAFRKR